MNSLFCPLCGDPLRLVRSELRCERGDLGFSQVLRELMLEYSSERPRSGKPTGMFRGKSFFCPNCGRPADNTDGLVTCETCQASLNLFLYPLLKVHFHA